MKTFSTRGFIRFIALASTFMAIATAHPWLYSGCIAHHVCDDGQGCTSAGQSNQDTVQDCDNECADAGSSCHFFVYKRDSKDCNLFQTNLRFSDLSSAPDSNYISGWQSCVERTGPINAAWSTWVDGSCSETCGPSGTMNKTRTCTSEGSFGGSMCADDDASEVVPCNRDVYPCPATCMGGLYRWNNTGSGITDPFDIFIEDAQGVGTRTTVSEGSARVTLASTGSEQVLIGFARDSGINNSDIQLEGVAADNAVSMDCSLSS